MQAQEETLSNLQGRPPGQLDFLGHCLGHLQGTGIITLDYEQIASSPGDSPDAKRSQMTSNCMSSLSNRFEPSCAQLTEIGVHRQLYSKYQHQVQEYRWRVPFTAIGKIL